MCVPCCQHVERSYLTTDGEVKQTWLDKQYPEGSKAVMIQDSTSSIAKYVWKRDGYFPQYLKVVDKEGNVHDICSCDCHRDGSMLMH